MKSDATDNTLSSIKITLLIRSKDMPLGEILSRVSMHSSKRTKSSLEMELRFLEM